MAAGYAPRTADATVLHRVVREHLDAFLAAAAARTDGAGVPPFIEREFREFLGCGVYSRGFARVRCDDCAFERLVPFSCKGRFCPSCGGRRMAEQAAHLVEAVLPRVPVRQWVLSVPHRLRYRLAFDHALCRAVLSVFIRALLAFYRRRARRAGVGDGHSGTVTVIQRFGGALNLHVHYHALALDGVFAAASDGALTFHPLPPPTDAEVARLLATIHRRVGRLLRRRGLAGADDTDAADPLAEESLALAGIASAAVQGRMALGPHAGSRVLQVGRGPHAPWVTSAGPRQAQLEGFDLHADVAIAAEDRLRLEPLCRYVLRPPVAQERLTLQPDGRVLVALKAEWHDGTTHLCFEPVPLLERLAALTPRPRVNLVVYHGVLAPHAAWRRAVVNYRRPELTMDAEGDGDACAASAAELGNRMQAPTQDVTEQSPSPTAAPAAGGSTRTASPEGQARRRSWAELLRHMFALDVLACPRCGGRMRVIATIEDPAVIRRILTHLGLPVDQSVPARAPPNWGE